MGEATSRHRVVIAATDFSPAADRAVEWAVELASHRRAELQLVHAVVAPAAAGARFPLVVEMTEDLLDRARRRMAETALRLQQRVPGLAWEVALGDPAIVVLAAAARHRPELIVVGTRGLGGWRHALLGSTAQRVLGRATCPVIAVHEGDPVMPARPLRLLAATDFSTDAEEATNVACRLLADAIGEVVVLHAFSVPLPAPPSEAFAHGELVGELREAARDSTAEQAARVRLLGVSARAELRDGYAPDVIAAAARELGADLVVMGSRGRGGIAQLLLGSCAERVLQLAPCPQLVLPRRAWQEAEDAALAPSPLVAAGADEQC